VLIDHTDRQHPNQLGQPFHCLAAHPDFLAEHRALDSNRYRMSRGRFDTAPNQQFIRAIRNQVTGACRSEGTGLGKKMNRFQQAGLARAVGAPDQVGCRREGQLSFRKVAEVAKA
jgi:hypothetical protein